MPDAGSPVSQTVAPRCRVSPQRTERASALGCQRMSGECSGSAARPARATPTMPAATVSCVRSSIRMKAPVARLSAYGSASTGAAVRSVMRPMSLSPSASAGEASKAAMSTRAEIAAMFARTRRVVCLSR